MSRAIEYGSHFRSKALILETLEEVELLMGFIERGMVNEQPANRFGLNVRNQLAELLRKTDKIDLFELKRGVE